MNLVRMAVEGRYIRLPQPCAEWDSIPWFQRSITKWWNRGVCLLYGHNPMLLQLKPRTLPWCADCERHVLTKKSAFPVWYHSLKDNGLEEIQKRSSPA